MTRNLLAIAAIAAAFVGTAAQAGEADYASNLPQVQSQRDRAEVRTEAAQAARTASAQPSGEASYSGNLPQVQGQADRVTVRAEAAQAVRLGQIVHGEAAI